MQSKRIWIYPTREQKRQISIWFDASRWTYNLTVEILQISNIPAAWKDLAKMVMSECKLLHPEWDSVPYQVKRTAVRDACRAMSNVKQFNKKLSDAKEKGQRMDEEFAELYFRSNQNPKQSCYVPETALKAKGIYHTILGPMRMAEAIPSEHGECRLVRYRGQFYLAVSYPTRCDVVTRIGDGAVALDPGVRSFITYFSETDCGKIGFNNFGRIQRLCHWLDDLISRTATETNYNRKRNKRKAQNRIRQKITNLIDELHWQTARWLVDNYRLILLPTFQTQDMVRKNRANGKWRKAGRKIQSKTARMMLSFKHYEFKQRLKWKAWQRGSMVVDVNEAYTSKTVSWTGEINYKLGSGKIVSDGNGFRMDRDINGARGIFLRALGDSPFLRGLINPQVATA